MPKTVRILRQFDQNPVKYELNEVVSLLRNILAFILGISFYLPLSMIIQKSANFISAITEMRRRVDIVLGICCSKVTDARHLR